MDNNVIYKVVTGSVAYGLDVAGSDIDIKAVYMPGENEYYGKWREPEETVVYHEPDIEFHTLKKFMSLLKKQNPTILEMLFVEDKFIEKEWEWFKEFRENYRYEFLSKKIYYTFGGYAREQLIRIKNSMKKADEDELLENASYSISSILEGIEKRYKGLNGQELIKVNNLYFDEEGKYRVDVDVVGKGVDFSDAFAALNEVNNTVKNFNKKKNRNKRVREGKLEKHAMHLVRILKMGNEVLRGEGVNVFRENDREEMLIIREGDMAWDDFFDYVDSLFEDMEKAYEVSELPEQVSEERIEELYNWLEKKWRSEW